uniref:Uncharacterized protein n=1 Tax=Panagrolaimus sp. ES5 TaxID=591445 RepID=A0AC34FZJ1_9BILA
MVGGCAAVTVVEVDENVGGNVKVIGINVEVVVGALVVVEVVLDENVGGNVKVIGINVEVVVGIGVVVVVDVVVEDVVVTVVGC